MTEEPKGRKRRPAKPKAGGPAKTKAGDAAAAAKGAAAAATEETAAAEADEAVTGPAVEESPAAEAAATDRPVAESPAEETAAADGPAAESPAAEAAIEEAPAAPAGGSAAEEAPAGERRPLTDQERAELYKQQLKELRLLDVARDMMLTLVTVGYQKLGLTDETRDLRDLAEAHLAIELLRGILAAVEGVAGADETETYRATLAQMQFNYARVAAEG